MFLPMSCRSPAAKKDAMTPLLGTCPILSWQILIPACMASLDIRISGTNDSPRSYISHCTVIPGIRALVTMSTGSFPALICSLTLGSTTALFPSRTAGSCLCGGENHLRRRVGEHEGYPLVGIGGVDRDIGGTGLQHSEGAEQVPLGPGDHYGYAVAAGDPLR